MSELLNLLEHLVALNSINPAMGGPGEREIAGWVFNVLQSHRIECRIVEATPAQPSVVARVRGEGRGTPILLNAHLDTVNVEGMETPFTLRTEGDRLFGRGTYDMKGSVAIMLALAEEAAHYPPPGDLWLTFSSDEEYLSVGTEALVSEWLPTAVPKPAAAIVLEPTEEMIGIKHKGFAWLEVSVTGRAGHGSRPEEAIDAILPLGAALQTVAELEREFQEETHDPFLGRASLHASTIRGGATWSVYPADATLEWERRTLPDEPDGKISEELARVIAAANAVNDAMVEGQIVFRRQPLGTPADRSIVRLLQSAAPNAELCGLSFWTDGALFGSAGIPTVIYGPSGYGAHAVDEWVSATSLERVLATLRSVINTGLTKD